VCLGSEKIQQKDPPYFELLCRDITVRNNMEVLMEEEGDHLTQNV